MSQSEYPLFSKKHPKNMRSWKGVYNFEKTKEYKLAEKWFEQRKEYKLAEKWLEERKETKIESILTDPPSKAKKGPPPGLTKPLPANLCKKCNSVITIPLNNGCCNNTFCVMCTIFEAELYNRCYSCKSVIDITKYDDYDGLNLTIPSYNDFIYEDSEKRLNLFQYIPLKNTSSLTVPDINIDNNTEINNQIRYLILANYQHYMEYVMLLAKSSQFISQ